MTTTLASERTGMGHVAASNAASERFFRENADAIAHACREMAQRFQEGGRLLVWGDASRRSDVAHVVVEFLHPVIVGKRALPAIAVGNARRPLAREGDILMELGSSLTLVTPAGTRTFAVPSDDPFVLQEIHEMLYHVLWEQVHVFLDHHAGAP